MLVATQQIADLEMIPAIVILAREILVSGLREYLAEIKVSVPVTRLAQWETAIQMVALGFLIVGDARPAGIPVPAIGEAGLWVARIHIGRAPGMGRGWLSGDNRVGAGELN